MRLYKYIPVVLLALAAFSSGCSTTTEPTQNSNSTITFVAQSKTTFYEERLDTTGGTYGQDQPDPNTVDSVHSTVIDTNASAYGKTHVTMIANMRSRGTSDTTYIWQDGSGNVYQYNYGVDILNNLDGIVQYLGRKIQVGWVLQSKLDPAVSGSAASWVASRDTEHVTVPGLPFPIDLYIADNASKEADTTVTIAGSGLTTVHTRHAVTANSALGILATLNIDNYMTPKYGTVMNVVHSFSVSQPISAQVSGQLRVMSQHP